MFNKEGDNNTRFSIDLLILIGELIILGVWR